MNYQKKLKQYQHISLVMEQNNFLQEYFKIIKYLYQIKNTLNILLALLGLNRGNLMKFQKKVSKI